MNNIVKVSSMLLLVVLLAGCSTTEELSLEAGTVAGGSSLGYMASRNIYGAVGGGVAGLGGYRFLRNKHNKQLEQAYKKGYEEALNQSTKEHYWMIQNNQKLEKLSRASSETRYIPVKIPEQEIDGVIENERIEFIRVKK